MYLAECVGEGVVPRRVLTPPFPSPHETMTTSTDLFTPAPGTAFTFQGVMSMRAVAYEGDALICNGINGWDDHHIYEVTAEDRADLSQFRVLENA